MKPRNAALPLLVAGLLAGALVWSFGRRDDNDFRPNPSARDPATPPASAPLADLPPAEAETGEEALAEKLRQRLNHANARADEGVLTFKDEASYRRFLERAAKNGLTVLGRIDALRAVRVRVGDYTSLARELLAHSGDYSTIGANTLVQTPPQEERTAHPQFAVGANLLPVLGVSGDTATWGRGVTIAILDGGVSADATLGGGRLSYLDIGQGYAGAGEDGAHATSVAALAAGSSPDALGVAPAASLLSIRVTGADGLSDVFTLTQAIYAAVDAGVQIVNISMGAYATSALLDSAITYADTRGVLIVAAAGNDQAAQLTWPAADTRVLSVGAVDATGQQVIFSNSGSGLKLTAPGYGIQTAGLNGERVLFSGTSASAPVASGSVAALMSVTGLSATEAARVLQTHASDGGAAGADPDYGNGSVNLGWAMAANDLSRADTALSSQYYNTQTSTVEWVVQNRGGQTVNGLTLTAELNGASVTFTVPSLAPGGVSVASLPVDPAQLSAAGGLVVRSVLVNPGGFTDQVPANNRKSAILSTAK